MADNEIALISLQQAATSAVKQCIELKIDLPNDFSFQASTTTPIDTSLSELKPSGVLVAYSEYNPERFNHNSFILATEVNEKKVGGNYLEENRYFSDQVANRKTIPANVSTTSITGDNRYGILVKVYPVVTGGYVRFLFDETYTECFGDDGFITVDGVGYKDREIILPAKAEYNIVSTREYYPVKLIKCEQYKQFKVTNETAGDFIIEDQIATTDSGLEFGLYAATAKVSCFVNETIKDELFDRAATVSIYRPIDKYSREELKAYSFTTSEIEESSGNICTIQLKNRITEMQEEYMKSIPPTEEVTIERLLNSCLGFGAYDIIDNGGLADHIKNTVVKQVSVESKSKYDFLLELCQIGMFNISFDKRFKIWRVF